MVVLQANKFFYERGGTERYLFLLCDALVERGHQVVHFSMHDPRNQPSPQSEYFVESRDFENIPRGLAALRSARRFIRSEEAAEKFARLLDDTQPDAVHLHNIYHQLTPSIIPEAVKRDIPVVMTLHDHKLVCPNYGLFANGEYCYRCRGGQFYRASLARCSGGSLARSTLLAAESYWQQWSGVYDRVTHFLTPSAYLRDVMISDGMSPRRVTHVPAFVESSTWSHPEDHDGYVLYFGRLSAEKGLDCLLDAFAQLPDIQLRVAGSGPEELRLRARGESMANVTFVGQLQRDAMTKAIARAALVVVPTVSAENAPFSVVETAMAGVPVVVSNRGGLPELADLVGGITFPAGNASALAEVLRKAWQDLPALRQAAIAGRDRTAQHFDRDRHLQALEHIYQRRAVMS